MNLNLSERSKIINAENLLALVKLQNFIFNAAQPNFN